MNNKATIVIHPNPIDSSARETLSVESGRRIHDYVVDLYPAPNFCGIPTTLHLNHVSPDTELTPGQTAPLLMPGQTLHIVHRPQGAEVALALAIISIVVGVASVFLIPDPEIPTTIPQTSKTSPNNSLQGQRNLARLGQAIPQLFGAGVSYPDLLSPSHFIYRNNQKIVFQDFCVGVGEYEVGTTRQGDSSISRSAGSAAIFYGPADHPSTLLRANEIYGVNGQDIGFGSIEPQIFSAEFFAVNDTIVIQSASFSDVVLAAVDVRIEIHGTANNNRGDGLGDGGGVVITSISIDNNADTTTLVVDRGNVPLVNETALAGIRVSRQNSFVRNTDVSGMSSAAFTFDEYEELGDPQVGDVLYFLSNTTARIADFRTVEEVRTGSGGMSLLLSLPLLPEGGTQGEPPVPHTVIVPANRITQWFTTPNISTSLRLNFQAPRGLELTTGNELTIEFQAQYQRVQSDGTPIGSIIDHDFSVTRGANEPQYFSEEITSLTQSLYRIRLERITNPIPDARAETVQWENCYGILPYSTSTFGDITIVSTQLQASTVSSSTDNRFNFDYTRRLPTWTSGGGFDPALTATRKFADAILYVLHVSAGIPLAQIDLAGLYAIQDGLSDQQLGEFTYTFDDSSVSLGRTVQTAANVARTLSYRDGQIWRFVRDEERPAVLMFNRRNIAAGGAQKQNVTLNKPGDFDGVVVEYVDPDTNKPAEIIISIDVDNESFVVGGTPSRPSRTTLAGCRNVVQATNRANYDVRRLIHVRSSVEDEVLSDGQLANVGDHVLWADIYDADVFEGEIVAIDGDVYTTSERLVFEDGVTYMGSISNANGSVTAAATVTFVSEFQFSASFVSSSPIIANNDTIQLGSKFLITKSTEQELQSYTVIQKTPLDNGNVKLQLAEYNASVFEKD